MHRVLIVICSGSFTVIAGLALATPPDMVDVRDELMGLAQESMIILRTTRDNLGVYDAEQRDIVLVETDWATGKETLHPVYRYRSEPDGAGEGGTMSPKVTGSVPADGVNPYMFLRERDGAPFLGVDDRAVDLGSIETTDSLITIRFSEAPETQIAVTDLLERFSASLDNLADMLGDYPRLAPVTPRDLIGGLTYDPATCQFSDAMRYMDDRGEPAQFIRVSCDTDGQLASLLVPLR